MFALVGHGLSPLITGLGGLEGVTVELLELASLAVHTHVSVFLTVIVGCVIVNAVAKVLVTETVSV